MMAQWLVHLLHKQKVGVQFPVMARAFFPTSIFYLPFPTSVGKVIELTIHQFGRILSSDASKIWSGTGRTINAWN